MAFVQASFFNAIPFHRLSSSSSRSISCCSAYAASSGAPSADDWKSLISKQVIAIEPGKTKRIQVAGVDQEKLVDPWLLADPDSRFAELHDVHIHYKIVNPEEPAPSSKSMSSSSLASQAAGAGAASSKFAPSSASADSESSKFAPWSASESSTYAQSSQFPSILLHGFGASLFSWERIMKPLADMLGSATVAFDRPAFGLTARAKLQAGLPNPYTIDFSGMATLSFMDFLKWKKAVLIGHSSGCIVAVDTYFKAPKRVAAIVMVAPALVAPLLVSKKSQEMSNQQQNLFPEFVSKVFRKLAAIFQAVARFFRYLWFRSLSAIFRSRFGNWLIQIIMDKLALQGVRMAWFNKAKIDEYVVSGYTKRLAAWIGGVCHCHVRGPIQGGRSTIC